MSSRPKILLLGDSLTQLSFEGWGAHLSNIYQRRADVINRGYSGYNTAFYQHLPLEDFEKVVLVLVFFGANDAALEDQDPHHYVSLPNYRSNLKTLVARVQEKYQCKHNILFLTPPPVQHEQRLVFQKQKYGDKATGILERTLENTGKYAAACQEVADGLGLPCLNLYNKMLDDPNWSRFFNDGLHFSSDGHEFVGKAVVEAINEYFPELAVTADPVTGQWANSGTHCGGLRDIAPHHDQIDHKDPTKAFETYKGV